MQLFQDLFTYTPESYLYTDLNSVIVEANQAAVALLNVPHRYLVGKPLAMFIADEYRAAFRAELVRLRGACRDGQTGTTELGIRLMPRDRVVPVDVTIRFAVLHDSQYEINGLCCLIHENSADHDTLPADKSAELERAIFLAAVSKHLAQSLEYTSRLSSIARAAVPFIADWCVLNIAEEDGTLRRVASAHADPAKLGLLRQLQQQYHVIGLSNEQPMLELEVMRTMQSQFDSIISDVRLSSNPTQMGYWQLLNHLGFRSQIIVPLAARGQTIGTLTLVRGDARKPFDIQDLGLAEEFAHRVAYSIDNARLYHDARQKRYQAEEVAEHAQKLMELNFSLSKANTLTQVSQVITMQARIAAGGALAALALLQEDQTTLEVVHSYGYSEKVQNQWPPLSIEAIQPMAEATRLDKLIWSDSIEDLVASYPAHLHPGEALPYHAWIAVPLRAHNQMIGVLGIGLAVNRPYHKTEADFLLAVGVSCAQALRCAQLSVGAGKESLPAHSKASYHTS